MVIACRPVGLKVEAACKSLARLVVDDSGVGNVLEANATVDSRLAEATVESAGDSLNTEITAILVSIPVEVAAVSAVGVGTSLARLEVGSSGAGNVEESTTAVDIRLVEGLIVSAVMPLAKVATAMLASVLVEVAVSGVAAGVSLVGPVWLVLAASTMVTTRGV